MSSLDGFVLGTLLAGVVLMLVFLVWAELL